MTEGKQGTDAMVTEQDHALALRATVLAAKVFATLAAFVAVVLGIMWSILKVGGPLALLIVYIAFVFLAIWVCALLDLRGQGRK
jgi:hypothetical protein